ncbi:MAG TPA: methyl-accepting chemotaxis protein [Ramlibacter sp.]|jgi:methyl-accepting chemotaxis protein|nr:methyl-accepting chemotaxis protein [Ramlibacter sp.]
MKVWHKMLAGPVVAILFLLAFGALAVVLMARQGSQISTLVKDRGAAIELTLHAYRDLSLVHATAYRTFASAGLVDADKLKAAAARHRALLDAIAGKAAAFEARPATHPHERALAQAVIPKIAAYRNDFDRAVALALSSGEATRQSLQQADASYQDMFGTFTALSELQGKLSAESSAQGAANFRSMLLALLAVALVAAAAALGVALAMSRQVVRPLQAARQSAHRIAQGDLTHEVRARGKDETGELLRAQAQMQQDLRTLVGEVATGARGVADASARIAQGHDELSGRIAMQASTLEETASSMEELTATVNQNADNARQASQLAVSASGVATRGGQVVGQVVETMTQISDSSRKIADIIGVIDGIAFQTNILALNAAVEAARAGEQGRGFAVVATEVRNLAQRSAAAAKEIKGLIGDSVGKVDAGARLVNDAGKTMDEIVASVKQVSDLIAEIAAASNEQSSGIAQVNTAVTQMDQVVQQNASLVEEAAAAAESMKSQAGSLLHLVSRFRLQQGEHAAAPTWATQRREPQPQAHPAPAMPGPIVYKPRVQHEASAALPPARHGDARNGDARNGEWRSF